MTRPVFPHRAPVRIDRQADNPRRLVARHSLAEAIARELPAAVAEAGSGRPKWWTDNARQSERKDR